MNNIEEEIQEWEELLNTGAIDEKTYDKEVNKLMIKASKKNNNNNKTSLIKIYLKILILVFLIAFVIWIYKNNSVKKEIEYVKYLDSIPNPIQTSTSGKTVKTINGSNIDISFVSTYKASGLVVDVQKYLGINVQNQLSPRDIGLAWGVLSKKESLKKIEWTSLGNRFLHWVAKDNRWINKIGGKSVINECFSNNHLIPSDDKTKKLIKSIKKGDYIRVEGYLVNVHISKSDGSYLYWNTSTSRTDSGDGACEIIYVTNVVWLKEQKN